MKALCLGLVLLFCLVKIVSGQTDTPRVMIPDLTSDGVFVPETEPDTCFSKGICINYYSDGRMKSEGIFIKKNIFSKKLVKNGVWKYYYYNNTGSMLVVEKHYSKGILRDTKKEWKKAQSTDSR